MSLEGHFCWEDCDEGPHGCICGNDCAPPAWMLDRWEREWVRDSGSVEAMSICDITTKEIPGHRDTMEVRLYEDGYYQVTMVDADGLEVDSIDGQASGSILEAAVGNAEDILISRYFDN